MRGGKEVCNGSDCRQRACPLRHCFAMPPLPKGEALAGRATFYWTPEARQGAKGRALLQRAGPSSYNLSVSLRSTAPLVGEPLAKRRSFPLCQSLPYKGQRRRPPPVAETGRSCWGSGQRDASGSEADAGSRNPALSNEVRLRGCTKGSLTVRRCNGDSRRFREIRLLREGRVIWQSSKISSIHRHKSNFATLANLRLAGKVGSLPIRGTLPCWQTINIERYII